MTAGIPPEWFWSVSAADEALALLAGRAPDVAASPAGPGRHGLDVGRAVLEAGSRQGVKVTEVTSSGGGIAACVAGAVPLVLVPPPGHGLLVVTAVEGRHARLLTPTGGRPKVRLADLVALIETAVAVDADLKLQRLPERLGAEGERLARSLRRLHSRATRVVVGWAVEVPEARRSLRITRIAAIAIGVHLAQFTFWVGSWIALVAALTGLGDAGTTLTLWASLLATALVLLPVESSLVREFALQLGIDVKRGLFRDALQADSRRVASLGLGKIIALTLEAHHLDAAAGSVTRIVLAGIDLALLALAYAVFAGVDPLLVLFGVAVVATGSLGRAYARTATRSLDGRLDVTSVHMEQLLGHRTRKAFRYRQQWNADEDRRLADYLRDRRDHDSVALWFALLPRVWLVLAVLVVLVDLWAGWGARTGLDHVAMVGFAIVAFAAFQSLGNGVAGATDAWLTLRRLDDAALRSPTRKPSGPTDASPQESGAFLCRGLGYRHPGSPTALFENVGLAMAAGDRVLLTGPSGSGKSTLAAVLAGRLHQDSGVVLSQGVDRFVANTDAWRAHVCQVPQAGTNHVLTGSLAFNLLLGRAWPPRRCDLDEAHGIAEALGLGDLLERMPAGLMQMVGDGGWTLSQGERARLFIARGILQRARLLIADEALSPLDAATALTTLDALERETDRLILIAHA